MKETPDYGPVKQLNNIMTVCPWVYQAWMLTTPRSGSTWLGRLLNKAVGLPEHADWGRREVLNRMIWDEHVSRGVDPRCVVVSKVMAEQAQAYGLTIEQRPPRLIYLYRRDEAEQAASMMCLAQRGRATAQTERIRKRLVEMPIEWSDAVGHHYLGRLRLENYYLRTEWVRSDVLSVAYEDVLADTEEELGRIMEYLEVENYSYVPDVSARRIGSPPEIVENMRRLLRMHETGKYE